MPRARTTAATPAVAPPRAAPALPSRAPRRASARPPSGAPAARATTTTAAMRRAGSGAAGARTSSGLGSRSRPIRAVPAAQLASQRAGAGRERRHVDTVRRREGDLIERFEQLAQIAQRGIGSRALHGRETLRGAERLVRIRNRERDRVPETLRRARRHGFEI